VASNKENKNPEAGARGMCKNSAMGEKPYVDQIRKTPWGGGEITYRKKEKKMGTGEGAV